MKWEYKKMYFNSKDLREFEIQEYLNQEGQDNWELVQMDARGFVNEPHLAASYTFIFKRQGENYAGNGDIGNNLREAQQATVSYFNRKYDGMELDAEDVDYISATYQEALIEKMQPSMPLLQSAHILLVMLERFYEQTYGKTELIPMLDFEQAKQIINKAKGITQ